MNSAQGFLITLESPMHPEDAERVRRLLMQIRGVIDVRPVERDSMNDQIIETRVRGEMWEKIRAALK